MGSSPPPKEDPVEVAKKQERIVKRAIRDIERETKKLENDEKKVLTNIKNLAQKNQHVS